MEGQAKAPGSPAPGGGLKEDDEILHALNTPPPRVVGILNFGWIYSDKMFWEIALQLQRKPLLVVFSSFIRSNSIIFFVASNFIIDCSFYH